LVFSIPQIRAVKIWKPVAALKKHSYYNDCS